jgi:hypothetical protein
LKKLIPWAVGLLVVFFIVRSPQAAAGVAHRFGAWLAMVGRAFADFFTALFG